MLLLKKQVPLEQSKWLHNLKSSLYLHEWERTFDSISLCHSQQHCGYCVKLSEEGNIGWWNGEHLFNKIIFLVSIYIFNWWYLDYGPACTRKLCKHRGMAKNTTYIVIEIAEKSPWSSIRDILLLIQTCLFLRFWRLSNLLRTWLNLNTLTRKVHTDTNNFHIILEGHVLPKLSLRGDTFQIKMPIQNLPHEQSVYYCVSSSLIFYIWDSLFLSLQSHSLLR